MRGIVASISAVAVLLSMCMVNLNVASESVPIPQVGGAVTWEEYEWGGLDCIVTPEGGEIAGEYDGSDTTPYTGDFNNYFLLSNEVFTDNVGFSVNITVADFFGIEAIIGIGIRAPSEMDFCYRDSILWSWYYYADEGANTVGWRHECLDGVYTRTTVDETDIILNREYEYKMCAEDGILSFYIDGMLKHSEDNPLDDFNVFIEAAVKYPDTRVRAAYEDICVLSMENVPDPEPDPIEDVDPETLMTWTLSGVDYDCGPSDTSVVVDSRNCVHICVSCLVDINDDWEATYRLVYSTNLSGEWTKETVYEGKHMGRFASMAVDLDGRAHMCYYDELDGDLEYATNEDGSWEFMTIDSVGDVGPDNDIAVDSSGYVHISYLYFGTPEEHQALKYATNSGGAWSTSTVDYGEGVGGYTSIALDSDGSVYISYCDWLAFYEPYDPSEALVKHATNKQGSWDISIVDRPGDIFFDTALDVDSDGYSHICYYSSEDEDLRYATNIDGYWRITTIDASGDIGVGCDIVLDSEDSYHISYYDWTNDCLRYATDSGGTVQVYSFPYPCCVCFSSAIAVDVNGCIHIVFEYSDTSVYRTVHLTNSDIPDKPDTPVNVEASPGDASVAIDWDVPVYDGGSLITGFGVYRSMPNSSVELLQTVGVDVRSFVDSELMNGVTYNYSVTALNDVGESPHSSWVSARPVGHPGAPDTVDVSSLGTWALIVWSQPAENGGCEISEYRVYKEGMDSEKVLLASVPASMCEYNDTEVLPGQTYVYSVSAVNDVGEGPETVSRAVTIPEEPASSYALVVTAGVCAAAVLLIIAVIGYRMKKSRGGLDRK